MSELLSEFESVWPYLKLIAVAVVTAIALIALAATVYTVKAVVGPLWTAVRWMFACGSKPSDIVSGISFGARMLTWAALIGGAFWILFHST